MKPLRPGSIGWLLSYELRLSWRTAKQKNPGRTVALIIAALALVIGGVPLGLLLAHKRLAVSTPVVIGVDLALLFVFTLMMNMSLLAATLVFFERGDMDLLLSSPLSGRKVLAVRAAVIAGNAFLMPAILVTPFLAPVVIFGHWSWLGLYPVLAAQALMAASAGIGLSMTLFRLIGPRAAKTAGQVIASLMGAAIFLVSQSARFFPHAGAAVMGGLSSAAAAGLFGVASPLSWPARGALGQLLPLAATVGVALGVFAVTAHVLGDRFVDNAARHAAAAAGTAVPVVLMAGQIAGSLAWITLSAEDAPDLIAASPLSKVTVRRAKLAAALQPVAALFALPILGLLFLSPRIALAAAVGSALSAISAALINLWLEKPAKRATLGRRRSSISVVFAELGGSLGWALATGLAAYGSWWCLVPAAFTLMLLGAIKVLAEPDRAY